jgi:hypothetical protein
MPPALVLGFDDIAKFIMQWLALRKGPEILQSFN